MARDTETFRAMLQAPRRAAQDKLAEANRRGGAICAELEQARKTLETISRRMGTEDDDAIYATLRQQYKETERQISGLETRLAETGKKEDRLTTYLDGIAAAVSFLPRESTAARAMAEDMVDKVDQLVADGTIARIAYETGVLQPTREQKRTLLRAIGARVAMYAAKSEYALTHTGKRWDLLINVPDDDNGSALV